MSLFLPNIKQIAESSRMHCGMAFYSVFCNFALQDVNMKRALLYLLIGTAASFMANYYFLESQDWIVDLYSAFAFGLGWGLAYYVDHPEWPLGKKLGISFIGLAVLLVTGFAFFNFVIAVPSVIKFSTVFVAYYLLASFKESKSLRY